MPINEKQSFDHKLDDQEVCAWTLLKNVTHFLGKFIKCI